MSLRAGQRAPDFRLLSAEGASVSLSDYRGRWVVLVFLRWLG
jgi:peroxiredoxin